MRKPIPSASPETGDEPAPTAVRLAPPRMATPARADRITVEELLELAQDGRLRVPSFQRKLKWDSDDKWKLLDSMERGYPIGTLLLWKRPAETPDIGSPLPRGPGAPSHGDVYLVVDGQQRITTLWEALALAPQEGRPTIVFDMASGTFVARPLRKSERGDVGFVETGAPPALPVHRALDAVTLSEWVPPALPRETRVRYFEVGKRLREYLVPIYVIEGDDTEILRDVFDRTNSTGKSLTRDEVFDALVGSRLGSGNERGLGLVQEQLREQGGFGSIDRATILKALEAIRGEKIGKLDPRALDPKKAEGDLLATARALGHAVTFLQSIGVPHVIALPYQLPLIVLSRVFHLHPSPDEKSLVLLKRWFWRGAAAARHAGSSGSLQQHVDDVLEGDESGSVHRLMLRTGGPDRPRLEGIGSDDVSIGTARGKVVLCALFSHAPRDLTTGDKLSPEGLFGDGEREVMRRIVPPRESTHGGTIGNRLLHPGTDSVALRIVRACADEGALASHGIDRDAWEAVRRGGRADIDSFLERRAALLEGWITRFVDARAEWERADTPSVRTLAHRRKAS